jgi:hypothetical protein
MDRGGGTSAVVGRECNFISLVPMELEYSASSDSVCFRNRNFRITIMRS